MVHIEQTPTNGNARPWTNGSICDPEVVIERAGLIERERMETWLEERIKASQRKPTVEIVTLTPTLAALLLLRNEHNRSVSSVTLERGKRDVQAGRWQFNGQSIVISKDGKLNDGQHRCHMVIETNQPIQIVMVFGTERKSRFTLDQGKARVAADYLRMNGYTNQNHVAAVAALIYSWKKLGRVATAPEERPTRTEIFDTAETCEGIAESLAAVNKTNAKKITSLSVFAFCYWAISQKASQVNVDTFFEMLISGAAGSKTKHPILMCRNKLIAMRGLKHNGPRIEAIFKGWNRWRKGEEGSYQIQGGKLPKLER